MKNIHHKLSKNNILINILMYGRSGSKEYKYASVYLYEYITTWLEITFGSSKIISMLNNNDYRISSCIGLENVFEFQ